MIDLSTVKNIRLVSPACVVLVGDVLLVIGHPTHLPISLFDQPSVKPVTRDQVFSSSTQGGKRINTAVKKSVKDRQRYVQILCSLLARKGSKRIHLITSFQM